MSRCCICQSKLYNDGGETFETSCDCDKPVAHCVSCCGMIEHKKVDQAALNQFTIAVNRIAQLEDALRDINKKIGSFDRPISRCHAVLKLEHCKAIVRSTNVLEKEKATDTTNEPR